MGKARVGITFQLLEALLGFPDGAHIRKIGQDFTDQTMNRFQIVVEHSDIPPTEPGELLQEANPSWERDDDGVITFVGWGL